MPLHSILTGVSESGAFDVILHWAHPELNPALRHVQRGNSSDVTCHLMSMSLVDFVDLNTSTPVPRVALRPAPRFPLPLTTIRLRHRWLLRAATTGCTWSSPFMVILAISRTIHISPLALTPQVPRKQPSHIAQNKRRCNDTGVDNTTRFRPCDASRVLPRWNPCWSTDSLSGWTKLGDIDGRGGI